MSSFLGLDTSNYTTSVAICFDNGLVEQAKKLLPVKIGEKGLRQSDAVFHHVNQIPDVFEKLTKNIKLNPNAVGVSAMPSSRINSYMPCFNVGISFAKTISKIFKVPYYEFSHQMGHIVASLYSVKKINLLNQQFLAFHVSGGTTEAVLVKPNKENILQVQTVAKTLDLNAGQLIDRVGVMLGLKFPAGSYLEKLALKYNENFKINPTLKGYDCCLSGVENLCLKMKNESQDYSKIAKFCIEYVSKTIEKMCEKILNDFSEMPVLFAGGVMSNSIIKQNLNKKFDVIFGEPDFSSDNAAGIAVLTAIKSGEFLWK